MYKLLTLIGNRPHFIKAASLSREIAKQGSIEEIIIHSGQHYDESMSGNFFSELKLPKPKYNLAVGSKSPIQQMTEIMDKLQAIIDFEQPDIFIVFGDTNTTAAGAITAAKNNIPLAHVEAGLREHNKSVPEEINKLLTDAVTDFFFVPTQTGIDNLYREGKTENVHLTGDIGIDLIYQGEDEIYKASIILNKHGLRKSNYLFMTCHRQVNTDIKENLENILLAINETDETVVLTLHPRTKNAIKQHELGKYLVRNNIIVLEPLGFWETQALVKNARICITDSGGIIKESYFHHVPAIIIDTQTEWTETVDEGWTHIVGPNTKSILSHLDKIKKPLYHSNCLGDGTAAKKIIDVFFDWFYRE